jgi:hypothetical protein
MDVAERYEYVEWLSKRLYAIDHLPYVSSNFTRMTAKCEALLASNVAKWPGGVRGGGDRQRVLSTLCRP